jgi:hypothetical protein
VRDVWNTRSLDFCWTECTWWTTLLCRRLKAPLPKVQYLNILWLSLSILWLGFKRLQFLPVFVDSNLDTLLYQRNPSTFHAKHISHLCPRFHQFTYIYKTAVTQWLRYCATNRKFAGLIPDGVIGIFHWHNPSDRTMAMGSTQPLTEMSTRSISWG